MGGGTTVTPGSIWTLTATDELKTHGLGRLTEQWVRSAGTVDSPGLTKAWLYFNWSDQTPALV